MVALVTAFVSSIYLGFSALTAVQLLWINLVMVHDRIIYCYIPLIMICLLGHTRCVGIGHRSASARRVVEPQAGWSSRPVDLTLHVAFHHRTQLVSVRTALDAAGVFQRTSRSQHLVLRGRGRAAATLRARVNRLRMFRHVYERTGRVFARGSRRQRVVVRASRLFPNARLRCGTDGQRCDEHDPRRHRQHCQCSWQRV